MMSEEWNWFRFFSSPFLPFPPILGFERHLLIELSASIAAANGSI